MGREREGWWVVDGFWSSMRWDDLWIDGVSSRRHRRWPLGLCSAIGRPIVKQRAMRVFLKRAMGPRLRIGHHPEFRVYRR
jgi:hypothetical protein